MLFAALAVSISAGLGATPAAPAGQAASQAHGTFTVELVKSLDSKKVKEGDEVEAKLTGGITLPNGTSMSRGSKVIGHVTEAKARSKGDAQSSLGIVFDKIQRAPGEETPIKGVVQAAAPNPNPQYAAGGLSDSYGDLKDATTKGAINSPTNESVPVLTNDSTGVLGIKGLQLGSTGVFTSNGKEVKLDSGIRMLLDVTVQ